MKRRHFLQNTAFASSALIVSNASAADVSPVDRPTKGIATKDGAARNNEKIACAGEPVDFKLLSQDTTGDLAIFVSSNNRNGGGPPLHVHHKLDEFFCVLEGEFLFQVGDEKTRLKPGDTMFVPRTVNHTFDCVSSQPGKLLVTIQPASNMEEFFREVGKLLPETGAPDMAAMQKLYQAYDSTIVGPPLGVK
ncbi:cupin domain-containing protein [Spirosoma arcticum]